MTVAYRIARPDDAAAICEIYAPIVRDTVISFEIDPPSVAQMQMRISSIIAQLPWFVSLDAHGAVSGYVYASRHRERAAYRWAVETAAYVRADCRGQGVAKTLYSVLFETLARLGYTQACAGITLPNAASVALHESMGFAPVGVYRNIGFKCGRWLDVGWWQKELQRLGSPAEPRRFGESE